MPYVTRSSSGEITSLNRDPVPGAEAMPSDHPEVLAFLDRDSKNLVFASLDAGLIRVLEDLVDVLIARNVINITDFPAEAQAKLFDRRHFRDRFRRNALNLFGNELPVYGAARKPAGNEPGGRAGEPRRSGSASSTNAPLANSLRIL